MAERARIESCRATSSGALTLWPSIEAHLAFGDEGLRLLAPDARAPTVAPPVVSAAAAFTSAHDSEPLAPGAATAAVLAFPFWRFGPHSLGAYTP